MSFTDRYPLAGTPVTNHIARVSNNRLGAVCSALHAFWSARQAATQRAMGSARRDAYSLLLFDSGVSYGIVNDVASSPDELLRIMLRYEAGGGTSFNRALDGARSLMEQNWSTDRFGCHLSVFPSKSLILFRKPVIIFLSDGEDNVDEGIVRDLCQSAIRLGYLSFTAGTC